MSGNFDGLLDPLMESGRLRKEPNVGAWFGVLEQAFPAGFNRINWDQVPNCVEAEILPEPKQIDADELEGMLSNHQNVVEAWLGAVVRSLDDEVIWLGDMTDFGLRLSVSELLNLFALLFSWPQHSYVLPTSGRMWCLNYTMEGSLFFGVARSAQQG